MIELTVHDFNVAPYEYRDFYGERIVGPIWDSLQQLKNNGADIRLYFYSPSIVEAIVMENNVVEQSYVLDIR